jgi:hypothetical protein
MAKRLLTPEIKDGILGVFEKVGGVDYLLEIARCNAPTSCRFLAAVMPSEIKASVTTTHRLDLGQAMIDAIQRLTSIEHQE